jgi:hypothetical protein
VASSRACFRTSADFGWTTGVREEFGRERFAKENRRDTVLKIREATRLDARLGCRRDRLAERLRQDANRRSRGCCSG